MELLDITVATFLTIVLILGGYQIYFLPQKFPLKPSKKLLISFDEKIPFRPRWVWVYSFFYYPFIASIVLTVNDLKQFCYVVLNFLILLLCQLTIAYFFPVKTPPHWREYDSKGSLSKRFLSLVHHFDKGGNCFPSMHVATSVLTALHIIYNVYGSFVIDGVWVLVMPALIAVSAIYTKQHYLIDIPAGALLGWLVFVLHLSIYTV
ncbi:phosphatase PAP2 family protein [Alteromonas sp. a30]|nr:phosphatase PAP2 family protein [Alteromonas sp. a30]